MGDIKAECAIDDLDITVTLAVKVLDGLTSEERMEVFGGYCTYCGSANPQCQCWNDE